MPLHHIAQRAVQSIMIECPRKPQRQRDHIGGAGPLQPLQKPQPALRIGQRYLLRTRNRAQRSARRPGTRQRLGQRRNRRRLEQAADAKLRIEARPNAADQPHRQ